MASLPQLQRDLRQVEDDLRLARARLAYYEARQELALLAEAQRVVAGHEKLHHTLTAQLHAFT